ncbi:MAG: type II secretion system F family protein [Candidatus Jorgensenbacteria bacterium]|nr:type II secretion system F family protein [Candidatus Jorgensenbacteria bacterium]
MKFSYKARTKEGELQVGTVDAASREAATNVLLNHALFVLSIEEVKTDAWYRRISDFFERTSTSDLMIFTRQFSTLLASQVPLGDSLRSLYQQTTKPVLKLVIADVAGDVDAGLTLSQALSRHPNVFSEFYTNMVRSAEVTGRLGQVLEFLADYLENQSILTGKVKNALIYPVFVIVLFFIVVVIMVTVVLPQITPIFLESKIALPLATSVLISVGTFISHWWFAVLIALVVGVFLVIDYAQTKEGKVIFNEISLRIPLFGTLFQYLYLSRFAESARVLIQGGLTIPQAIEISSHTVGNVVFRDTLREAAQSIRKGELLSQALKNAQYFPPLVSQLIAIGESTGRLEMLLSKISDYYRRQVEDKVGNLVELIQPALLVIIGGLVALLFAAILLPLYSLTQTF